MRPYVCGRLALMDHPELAKARESVGLWRGVLNSVHEFDKGEVRGVIAGLLNLTADEICYLGIYYRVTSNVETMLELKSVIHFQALAMIARALFELAVEIELLHTIPDAPMKMRHLVEVEKLRHAKRMIAFASAHDTKHMKDVSVQAAYVANNGARIDYMTGVLWPGIKPWTIMHWTTLKLPGRVAKLDLDAQEIYERHYAQLSWAAHAGLTAVLDRKAETFASFSAITYELARWAYEKVLTIIIRKFRLSTHDPLIDKRMTSAILLPFTEGPDAVDRLLRDLGL